MQEEGDRSQNCNKKSLVESIRFQCGTRKSLHHRHKKTPSQTQSSPLLVFKQLVDLQLQPRVLASTQISAPLQSVISFSSSRTTYPWYGRGDTPFHKEEKKTMIPAPSSSSPPSPSSRSDTSENALLEVPKTKIVVRGLPPSLSENEFRDSIIPRFEKFFKWVSFCPGKVSMRKSRSSRAYIDFIQSEDVFKFYEHYNGHVFVSERGTQYKALVHYALHQRVPTLSLEKDNEEGSILADPEYSEFVSGLAKPAELLPSAEVQLERREAEKRSSQGFGKETIIVTPLMQHVRDRRALKEKSSLASSKQISRQKNSAVVNSNLLPKSVPDISRDYFKYASKTMRPTEKLTYAPRSPHKVSECKDSVSETNRETVLEGKVGLVARERGLGNTRQEERNDDKDLGVSKHAVSRSVRKECKPQHTDFGKKSKHMGGFRGPQKQVWVAKPASGK